MNHFNLALIGNASIKAASIKLAIAMSMCSLFIIGCSSSSDGQPPEQIIVASPEVMTPASDGDDATIVDDAATDNTAGETPDDIATEGETDATTSTTDSDTTDATNSDDVDAGANTETDTNADTDDFEPVVVDPLTQNTTRVNVDIEVPAFQSNELQVRLTWGDKDITAAWLGDEFWSVSDDFPTNTEHLLTVTFSDGNGAVTLASFEQIFKTGTNSAESFQVTVDQFDSARWDADGDGISNLDELIAGVGNTEPKRVLLFTETRGFRHESIEAAVIALEELASSAGMESDHATDSAGVFTDENLAKYDAVVWVLTSGDVLGTDEQAAFENYIRSGGGYAGIHAASDTEYEWPWYGTLVGAYFERHPAIQAATQHVEDGSHPSTAHLDLRWTRTDEWYDYSTNPRAKVNVLLSLDEDSYSGGTMGEDHPSAWYHDFDGGRSWYTGGGHTSESYAEPDFRAHLLGGLQYATGVN